MISALRTIDCQTEAQVRIVEFDCDPSTIFSIEQSNGTCSPSTYGNSLQYGYVPDALIPREPWRKVDVRRTSVESTCKHGLPSRFVGLWRVPHNIMCFVPQNHFGASYEQVKKFVADPKNVGNASRKLLKTIRTRFVPQGDLIVHGIAVSPAGLPTVTRDRNRGNMFIGLHVDSWDNLPFFERRKSLYRIAINIGRAPRYFLFADVDLLGMRDCLLSHHGPDQFVGQQIHKLFLRAFSDYPITRIRIDPGFAYIAPTDVIVHDGSTVSAREPSVHLTVRGRFQFKFQDELCKCDLTVC